MNWGTFWGVAFALFGVGAVAFGGFFLWQTGNAVNFIPIASGFICACLGGYILGYSIE